jgi:hypothetical protein
MFDLRDLGIDRRVYGSGRGLDEHIPLIERGDGLDCDGPGRSQLQQVRADRIRLPRMNAYSACLFHAGAAQCRPDNSLQRKRIQVEFAPEDAMRYGRAKPDQAGLVLDAQPGAQHGKIADRANHPIDDGLLLFECFFAAANATLSEAPFVTRPFSRLKLIPEFLQLPA